MIVNIDLDTIQYETSILIIDGMTCASCSSSIKTELSKYDGVQDTTINLITGKCIIKYDIYKITIRRILSIIEYIGFTAKLIDDDTIEEKVVDRLYKDRDKLKIPLYILVCFGMIAFIGMLLMMFNLKSYMTEIYPGISICTMTTMILGVSVQCIVGLKHYKIVWNQLKGNGLFNMDTLIILSTSLSICLSIWMVVMNIISGKELYNTFFDTSVFIFFFVYIGKYLEINGKLWAANLMTSMIQKDNTKVRLVKDINNINNYIEIDNKLVSVDDILLIRPGENVPCDSVIVVGESYIDESMLTGESIPIHKKVDDILYGGTVNISETICIKATHTGKNTCLNRMRKLIEDAQMVKTSFQNTTDKICKWFVYGVLSIAIITLIVWLFIGSYIELPDGFNNITYAIYVSISVIVVSCPCALGLATPIAIMVGSGIALRDGMLLKNGGETIEKMSKINTIIFDKTGTLTYGKLRVTDIYKNDIELFEDAYILSCISNHPLSHCIRNYCKIYEKTKQVNYEKSYIGKGVECKINKHKHYLGSKKWLDDTLFEYEDNIKIKILDYERNGYSIVLHAIDNRIVNVFAMMDTIREEAYEVISLLKNMNIDVWLLSGDNKTTVRKVAEQIGINDTNVVAEVLPDKKAAIITDMYEQVDTRGWYSCFGQGYSKLLNKRIAMVGDGGNDSIALSKADVGIAMRSGSDLALSSASVILMKSSLMDVYNLKRLSDSVMRTIYINLIWATSYNLIAIPLAAGVFYPMHLNPMCSGLAMSLSSVVVVMNSVLLSYIYKRKVV